MNNSKLSSLQMLKILGCLIFDMALMLAFLKTFGLFFIIDPGKSILILLVLLIGLLILNEVVVFSDRLFISIGLPYSVSTITLVVLYVLVANIFSILLIPENIVWYVVWQLIVLAIFIIIFSIIISFSNQEANNTVRVEHEKAAKAFVMSQLTEIEDAFTAKEDQKSILKCLNLFKALKERIQFSTPFGRISNNDAVTKSEKQINDNLVTMKVSIQGNLDDKNLVQLQKMLEDTRRIVINREALNIK